MKPTKYILEITIFVCGAVIMIYELVGSRVLGPYFGTSIFIWTSLIGIVLASLSLGYYLGGKWADKNPNYNHLALIIFGAAMFIGLTTLSKTPLLTFLQIYISDIRTSSIIASLILFAPASVLLGMVSPYAAKLKLNDLNTSGSTIGKLYAISTVGSIVGTFLSGFYLIPRLGTNKLLIILSLILITISLMLSIKRIKKYQLFGLLILPLVFGTALAQAFDNLPEKKGLLDIDTAYNRVWIYDHQNKETGDIIRTLLINNEHSSAMFLNRDDLVYEYTKYYHLARHFYPDFKKTLMLGGAGYSYPKDFLKKYPEAVIDVVEIDPQVTALAKKYFSLEENPRLNIFHEDGRVYLNKTLEKYDVIFGDAFSSHYSIPYQLTTREAVQKHYDVLTENGIVILNIISAIEGKSGQFLRAEYATYKDIFPQVYLFPTKEPTNGKRVQNIILIALKSEIKPDFISSESELTDYLNHLWTKEIILDKPILTDDFAPVDHYIGQVI